MDLPNWAFDNTASTPIDLNDFIHNSPQFPSSPPAYTIADINENIHHSDDSVLFVSDAPTPIAAQQEAQEREDIIIPSSPISEPDNGELQFHSEETGKPFRLAAKSVFLTFPKCYLTDKEFLAGVNKWKFEQYYAVQEEHQDGTPHFHILGEWSSKKNIKSPKHFDIGTYHPNIGRTKNRLAALNAS